jgi:hypothetical protein
MVRKLQVSYPISIGIIVYYPPLNTYPGPPYNFACAMDEVFGGIVSMLRLSGCLNERWLAVVKACKGIVTSMIMRYSISRQNVFRIPC